MSYSHNPYDRRGSPPPAPSDEDRWNLPPAVVPCPDNQHSSPGSAKVSPSLGPTKRSPIIDAFKQTPSSHPTPASTGQTSDELPTNFSIPPSAISNSFTSNATTPGQLPQDAWVTQWGMPMNWVSQDRTGWQANPAQPWRDSLTRSPPMGRGGSRRSSPQPQGSEPFIAHRDLIGACVFIPMPSMSACTSDRPPQQHVVHMYTGPAATDSTSLPDTRDLFVAQLPFNMTLDTLQTLCDRVIAGVQIIHAAPHYKRGKCYDGCAFVKLKASDADRFVAAFHKAVLFDAEGVWIAQTDHQRAALSSYCNWMSAKTSEERRTLLKRATPFSSMTAEPAKRSYVF